jgi:hypothetical protein
MQRACGDLSQSELFNCLQPMQGGVGNESRLVLVLRKDLLLVTEGSGTTQDLITAITLGTNKTGFVMEGFKQSLKPKYRAVKTPSGQTMYVHELEYMVYSYSQLTKNNLTAKGNGRYVAIYENAKTDSNAFEMMGLNVGLEVLELERAPQENGGAFRIKLSTPENEFEGKMPQTIFTTDYTTTASLVNALIKLPTITSYSPLAATAAGGTAITVVATNLFGGGTNSAVTNVSWINQATGTVVNQPVYVVVSDVSMTLNTVAMAAGLYKLRITTLRGVVTSVSNLVVT